MIAFTDITGLLSSALAVSVLIIIALPNRVSVKSRRWIFGGLFLALLFPLSGQWIHFPLAIYPRGIIGDLSITSLVLLLLALAQRLAPAAWRPILQEWRDMRTLLLSIVAILALLLYPMALGLTRFDPYALGYPLGAAPLLLIVPLAVLGYVTLWVGYRFIALLIALVFLAWAGSWYESSNLWDYLIDPWLATVAFSALIRKSISKLIFNIRNQSIF